MEILVLKKSAKSASNLAVWMQKNKNKNLIEF